MEEKYIFKTKFVEGKTYEELQPNEIERLKKGVGIKSEDKKYLEGLKNKTDETQPTTNETSENGEVSDTSGIVPDNEEIEQITNKLATDIAKGLTEGSEVSVDVKVDIPVDKKSYKIIQAIGRKMILENNKIVTLTDEEIKEKPFWRKGDMYYGS